MLDAASLQAVPIPHRQGVATCSEMDELCHGAASLSSWLSHQHGITPSWPQHSPRQQWQPHGGTSPVSSWGSGQHRGLMQRCLQQHGGLQLLPGSKADPLGCIEPLSWSGMQKGGLSGLPHPPVPLVVSLSRIMKDPNVFPGLSSCRSASFLLIPLKNHLQQEQSKQRPLLGARKPRLAQAGAISPGRWGHGV